MSLKLRPHHATRRVLPRAAAVALALGGLTASIAVADSAGATSRAKGLVISTTTNPKYGTILVSGTTVYTLKTASKVSCGVKCLKVWPRVLLPKGVKQAKAGGGVDATKLGTVKRRGGALQVTYAGKPLFWFYEDSRPNQVKGDVKDKWGTWSVVVTSSAAGGSLPPAAGTTTVPTTAPMNRTTPGRVGPPHPAAPRRPARPRRQRRRRLPHDDGADDHPHDLASHDDHDVRRRWWRRHRLLTLDRGTRGAAGTAPPVAVSRWWQGPARRAPMSPRAIVTAPTR